MKRILTAIACACAFATACNAQMTAARMMAFAQTGGALSAKSYVQEGLVHQWDAIENVNFGNHDNNSQEWVDLIGGYSAVLSGGEWGENVLKIGNNNATFYGELFSPSATIEFIFSGNTKEAQVYAAPLTCTDDSWSFFRRDGVNWEFKLNNNSARGMLSPFFMKPFFVRSDPVGHFARYHDSIIGSTRMSPFITSTKTWQIGGNSTRFLGTSAKIYAIRIYARALTDAEISANYAVDKARFNLP